MNGKSIGIILVAMVALVYIINPGAGFIELIPDNFPIIGNLDEAGAVFIIVSALKHFGIDFPNIFKKEEVKSTKSIIKVD